MDQHKPVIRTATKGDERLLGNILGDAFYDDAAFNWVIPPQSLYPGFFTMIVRQLYLQHGHAYIDSQGRGAALWLPPGVSAHLPASLAQWWLVLRLVLKEGPDVLKRLQQAEQTMSRYHPSEPHYYLHAIGARRQNQGQGIGSALLKEVTRKCDEECMPAYLESSSERNAELYQRHGFEIFDEQPVGKGGPPLKFMWRSPIEK